QPADDPHLSSNGQTRARLLAYMLGDANIKAIYTTPFARTRETAQPLAKEIGLTIDQIDITDYDKFAARLLADHRGESILVVGHSNTLAQIIAALGGGQINKIADNEYDNFYIVTVYQTGKAKINRLKYGNGDSK